MKEPTVYILDNLGRVAMSFPRHQPINGLPGGDSLAMQIVMEFESFPVGVEPYDTQEHSMAVMVGQAERKPEHELPSLNMAPLVWIGEGDDIAFMMGDPAALEPGRRLKVHGMLLAEPARPEADRLPSIWTLRHVPEGLELWEGEAPMPAYTGTVRATPAHVEPRKLDIGVHPPTVWIDVVGATGRAAVEALADVVPWEIGTRIYFTAKHGSGVTGAVPAELVTVFPEVRA